MKNSQIIKQNKLDNILINPIKNSCSFKSIKNRFQNPSTDKLALLPGPGSYNLELNILK